MTGSFEGERLAVPRADGKGWELTQLTATLVSIALCDVRLALTLTLTLILTLALTLTLGPFAPESRLALSAPTGLQYPPRE